MNNDKFVKLNEKYQNLMDDETSNKMVCGTISNFGIPYEEEDFEETLLQFKKGQEYFQEIYSTL